MTWKLLLLTLPLVLAGCTTSGNPASGRSNTSMAPNAIVGPENDQWDTPPRLVRGKRPIYPISQNLSRQAGTSLISYVIGTDGRPRDFVVESTTNEKFANHAIIALRDWLYEPARKDGEPVEASVRQSFEFQTW